MESLKEFVKNDLESMSNKKINDKRNILKRVIEFKGAQLNI